MPSIRIDIAPAILNWIINQINVDRINESVKDNLIKWQLGEKRPTFKQLEDVSKKINIPFGYFFLQEPPIEDTKILEYRTIDSVQLQNPSRELIDTIDNMEAIKEWMRNYQISEGYSELDIIGSVNQNMSTKDIATKIRKDLGLKLGWFSNQVDAWDSFKYLRSLLEKVGIVTMLNGVVGQNTHRILNIEEFRAFTLLDKYAPLIFINSNDSSNGKLFSLLHEVVHIWIGTDNFYNDRYGNSNNVSNLERICNAIAAEIMVPNDLFVKEWLIRDGLSDNKIKVQELTRVFKCGATVIARKALDNNYISNTEYDFIAKEAVRLYKKLRENRPSDGGDFYKTINVKNDKRLILALNNSIYEGNTQFTDAYRLTNTTRKTFSGLVDEVRGVRRA